MHERLKEGSLVERRAFIRCFIEKIKETDNEAIIIYTIPFPQDNMDIEKEGVLPIVQYGGPFSLIDRTDIVVFKAVFAFA